MHSPGMIFLTVVILLLCSANLIKESFQLLTNLPTYIKEYGLNNMLEWILYICTFVFLLPINEIKTKSQIEAGAISIFLAWINFIWFLKRLPIFGIYVVLTKKVFLSLIKVLPVVILFIVAFAMTFLLLRSKDHAFSTIPWSALTTLIMMGGEIDYRDVFVDDQSPVYVIQCMFLVLFFLVMSIVVMNVFVGLAVGDIGEMMRRSEEEKRLHRARLYIEFEESLLKLPKFFRPEQIKSVTNIEWVPQIEEETDNDEMKSELKIIKNDLSELKRDMESIALLLKERSETYKGDEVKS
ncbi:transient receptor potential cation channel subfamily A member 1-like [Dendronephthya gigantea]|uniref:transient receptor potential cation channel subfamily A member 1-like n=1 Tax=Dendronephthya gigantea TaxID=151771 RepID=UPI00106A6CE7|nr:transient receptor potential cation channel subfamily A member 1-like [Dendronephthya gigantea]